MCVISDPNHLLQIVCRCLYGVEFSCVDVSPLGVRCACITEIIVSIRILFPRLHFPMHIGQGWVPMRG